MTVRSNNKLERARMDNVESVLPTRAALAPPRWGLEGGRRAADLGHKISRAAIPSALGVVLILALTGCTGTALRRDDARFEQSLQALNLLLENPVFHAGSTPVLSPTAPCKVKFDQIWSAAAAEHRGYRSIFTTTSINLEADVSEIVLVEPYEVVREDRTEKWVRHIRIVFREPLTTKRTHVYKSTGKEGGDAYPVDFLSVGIAADASADQVQQVLASLNAMRAACGDMAD
jgi:hypothetical protein